MIQSLNSMINLHTFDIVSALILCISAVLMILLGIMLFKMVRYAILNVHFPENNFINNINCYETKSSPAGNLYYFCTFVRKIMCVLIIVLFKDINQVAKVILYVMINIIWIAYVILCDPLKTKITKIVSVINEVSYIILIIASCKMLSDTNDTFILCMLMVLRSALGIFVISAWKFIFYTTSQDFIDTIKPFHFVIRWKIKKVDPDLISQKEPPKKKAKPPKAVMRRSFSIN